MSAPAKFLGGSHFEIFSLIFDINLNKRVYAKCQRTCFYITPGCLRVVIHSSSFPTSLLAFQAKRSIENQAAQNKK
jgi:hypothetical protein